MTKKLYTFRFLLLILCLSFLFGCTVTIDLDSMTDNSKEQHNSIQSPQISFNLETKDDSIQKEINPVGDNEVIEVHFIDVGQGDAILVTAPNDKIMLIDAGNNGDGKIIIDYLRRLGLEKIDVLIGTHPHADHLGGLDEVIRKFQIGSIYLPRVSHNTKTYEEVLLAIKEKGLKINEAKGGLTLDLGPSVTGKILAPNKGSYDDLNDYSVVVKISFGENSFLFTGDAEALSEKEMLAANHDLKADILKVGHHGSSTSTSSEFLKAVAPDFAVISVGKDNSYNHPHKTVLNRLNNAHIKIYRTDQHGDIKVISDGQNIEFVH